MTTERIDFLAVLDDIYSALTPHERKIRADEFTGARAAVVELIEAAQSAVVFGLNDTSIRELRTALARVVGAS